MARKSKTKSVPSQGRGKQHLRALLPLLRTLKSINSTHRAHLIAHIDDRTCDALCETVSNVLSNPNVSAQKRRRLKKLLLPYKTALRVCADKGKSVGVRKKKLEKIGGFPLGAILGTAIPLLTQLLFSRHE